MKEVAIHARTNCPLHTDIEIAAMVKAGTRTLRRWISQDSAFAASWYFAKHQQMIILGLLRVKIEIERQLAGRRGDARDPRAWVIDKYLQKHGVDWVDAANGTYLVKAFKRYHSRHSSRA
ncbi:MAG TPA: hypothetical protein VGL38_03920 [bacterium]